MIRVLFGLGTKAKKHSLKYSYFQTLVCALQTEVHRVIHEVKIFFVIPMMQQEIIDIKECDYGSFSDYLHANKITFSKYETIRAVGISIVI